MSQGSDFPFPAAPPVLGPPTGVDVGVFTLAYLETHEAECPACGYNVHRLVERRCPECGNTLVVKVVATVGGYSIAWILGMIVAALTAGIGILMSVFVSQWGLPHQSALCGTVVYFMCNLPMPLVALGTRRWFVRSSGWFQWICTSIFLLVAIIMTILFFAEL